MTDLTQDAQPPRNTVRLLYRYEALTPDGRVLSGWFPDEATARTTFERASGG